MYFSVLRHGEATAKTLADDADISIRYAYDVAEQLAERGFVTMNDHTKPATVRARQPGDVVSDLVNRLRAIESRLNSLYVEPEPQETKFEILQARQTVLRRVQSYINDASNEVMLMVPVSVVDSLYDMLEDAVDRGLLVVLLVTGNDPRGTGLMYDRLEGKVSVARVWREETPFMLSADVRSGIISMTDALHSANEGQNAVAVSQNELVATITGSFLSNYWPMAEEIFVRDPPELPETYDHFRHAVFDAMLYKQYGNEPLYATVRQSDGTDAGESEFSGEVVQIRQSLLQPPTNSFPIESSLILATDQGRRSVGGANSFLEDIQAKMVTLEAER